VSTPVLWQFRISHFNEKARWALDWKGIPHIRRSLLPALHLPRILWMTGQKSVPVLVLDGKAIADSTRIIETLERLRPEPPLYPPEGPARRRALELEEFLDEELGPHARRAFFHEILPHTDYAAALMSVGERDLVRRLYRGAFPVVRQLMKLDMKIDADSAARSRAKVEAALERIAAERQPSGYLVGDGFTVADLTGAALLFPIVLPAEFPYPFPGPLPDEAERLRQTLRRHPACEWAAAMYRRHRGRTSMEVAA
jgi:glutathione S-transferase